MSDKIHIRELSLYTLIGEYDFERCARQPIVVSLILHTSLRRAGESDILAHTIDYAKVEREVVALVESAQFRLVEALAEAIAGIALADERVTRADVTVEKPGALAHARTVAIEITRERPPLKSPATGI